MESAVGSIVNYLLSMGLPGVIIVGLAYGFYRMTLKVAENQAKRDAEVQALNDKVASTLEKVIPIVSDLPQAVSALHNAVDRLDRVADRLGDK